MKQLVKYIPAMMMVIIAASCEKEVNVAVPKQTPKLVLHSQSESGDTIRVRVGKSLSILDYKVNKDLSVADAQVVLYTDGKAIDTLVFDEVSRNYLSRTVSVVGKEYTIRATAPTFAEVTATAVVTEKVPIVSARRIHNARVTANNVIQDEIRVEFNDPPQAGNYYIIKLEKQSVMNESSEWFCVNTTDASIESIYADDIDANSCIPSNGIFMKDVLFNGGKKELRFFVDGMVLDSKYSPEDSSIVTITLLNVSADHYKFEKSYLFASDNESNPFSEPINVYTNVKNGYGIFSIISSSSAKLE